MTPAAPPPLQPCKPGIDRRGGGHLLGVRQAIGRPTTGTRQANDRRAASRRNQPHGEPPWRQPFGGCLAAIYIKLLKNSIKSEHISLHGRRCTRKMGVRAPHGRLRRWFLSPSARPKPTDLLQSHNLALLTTRLPGILLLPIFHRLINSHVSILTRYTMGLFAGVFLEKWTIQKIN